MNSQESQWLFLCFAQPFEQYFTDSQSRFHFLRQVKARKHTGQIFVGRSDFFFMVLIKL